MTNRRFRPSIVRPRITVGKIRFEDFGGSEFERLVFAYHVRAGWRDVAWYGQTGSDLGRDIIGTELFEDGSLRRTVVQCVNRRTLSEAKALRDMTNAVQSPTGTPDAFKFVCRESVSAKKRDSVSAAARRMNISHLLIWSGVEFEENLRLRADDLLQRFCAGEAFPDGADEIRRFADDFPNVSDAEALSMMAPVFDRPAFRTPFQQESSLPAFLQAIEDTIAALNTGIWRTREGSKIRRIPSVHHLRDPKLRAGVAKVVHHVDELRRIFVGGMRDGRIRHCGCGDPNCPVFMISHGIDIELDTARSRALDAFRSVHTNFTVLIR